MLHRHIGETVVHRDRPIFDTPFAGRPRIEHEADYFGACFLAPRKLVTEGFSARFGSQHPLRLTETIAFHLRGDLAHELFISPVGSLDFAAAVAGAQKFDINRFSSLAEYFGMSISAMAIRLKELQLVTD